ILSIYQSYKGKGRGKKKKKERKEGREEKKERNRISQMILIRIQVFYQILKVYLKKSKIFQN
ncbi:hypothetical protein, partial [Enterococcus faecalis]|uniref:hypothetical protein n=1 Tax=Enterococcus faecalis TaxID=1351 RepID=UPI001C61686C